MKGIKGSDFLVSVHVLRGGIFAMVYIRGNETFIELVSADGSVQFHHSPGDQSTGVQLLGGALKLAEIAVYCKWNDVDKKLKEDIVLWYSEIKEKAKIALTERQLSVEAKSEKKLEEKPSLKEVEKSEDKIDTRH